MQATISSKFQVVIPKALCERLHLKPQQKLTILEKRGILYLIPEQEVSSLRGVASGLEVTGYRDKSDRVPDRGCNPLLPALSHPRRHNPRPRR